MTRILFVFAALLAMIWVLYRVMPADIAYPDDKKVLAKGQKLFATHCVSCHDLAADGMGPRLGGVTLLLSRDSLVSIIKDPTRVIASGNQRAVALHARYKQSMPSYAWMGVDSIHAILSYIDYETRQRHINALTVNVDTAAAEALTGKLLKSIRKSGLKVELEDFIRIPRPQYSTPDLGIVTLRPHPSGDGRLFVSDQAGILYQVANGKAEVFLDLRQHIKDFSIGPGLATGLGSFDFHPDFLNNGLIYITHAEKYLGQQADYVISDAAKAEVQWVLAEWKVKDVTSKVFRGTRRELLRVHAPTFGHGAQDIGFIAGLPRNHPHYGLLYFGFGDGGSNNIGRPELGHHPKSFLGTILRIDPLGNTSRNGKYGIPADNPFVSNPDPETLAEIWAYGFRNPHRLAWDPANDFRMIATDIGEANIEEINIIERGGDYGWPDREGNFGIATTKDLKTVFRLPPGDTHYKAPYTQYDHTDGYAISGGYVYDGTLEALRDKYIFGDIVNGKLFYVTMDEPLTDSVIHEITIIDNGKETTLRALSGIKRLHLRISYDRFSGNLYVITKADGLIRRVVKAYW